MSVDPNRLYLDSLEGTGLAIFSSAIILGAISLVVVLLRSYVRLHERAFGWDDGLMVSGLVIFIVEVGLACMGALSGLGRKNADLNATMQMNAMMYLMIWMLLYISSLVFIKGSICVTMLRIASVNSALRISVFVLLAIAVGTFVTTFIGVLCLCSPVEANWNTALLYEGKATCASMSAMIGLSYTSTASSIATDLACAVLPGFILWKTQMKAATKIWVSLLLSFGSFASISTILRTPYIHYYLYPEDNLVYHISNIVLLSNIETSIGLVAGSLPSLRRFVVGKIRRPEGSSGTLAADKSNGPPLGLVTFGSTPMPGAPRSGRKFKNPTDLGVSVATIHARGDGDWRRLHDDSSSAKSDDGPEPINTAARFHGIRRDVTYEVESMHSPLHATSFSER